MCRPPPMTVSDRGNYFIHGYGASIKGALKRGNMDASLNYELKQIKEELHRTNKILERVVESLERRNTIEEAVRELASEGKDETAV